MPPHLIFGAAGIGTTEKSFTYVFDTPEKVSVLLNVLRELNLTELDSAASYPPTNPWNTETLLGQAKAIEKGFIIDSKVLIRGDGRPTLDNDGIASSIARTLELLGTDKVRTLYAHQPDRSTPLEVTAKAFDELYREGKFERLGLSHFRAADIGKYFDICNEHGYVKPTVYQGQYNALARDAEEELIPLLRKHGCAYYAFSPLAGGFLTGKVTFSGDLERTRWVGESQFFGYVNMYDRPAMHDAIRQLKAACDAAQPPMSLVEASMRWIVNHSALREGDGIILGASKIEQLRANVEMSRRGPLEEKLLTAVEGLWELVQRGNKEKQ